jgi:hypothetical protein
VKGLAGCATLVALALAGCGGDGRRSDDRAVGAKQAAPVTSTGSTEAPATEQEVAWAGRVIDWAILVGTAVEFANAHSEGLAHGEPPPAEVQQPLAKALRALGGCGSYAKANVGKSPSARLESVQFAVESACGHYAAGAAAALELLRGAGDHAPALVGEWEATWEKGDELMASISEELVGFQPANTRALPEKSGEALESRIEPEFGAVASALVETDVEVRCWSERDWEALMGEMKRFTNGRIGEGTVGFAGHGDDRLNLAPEICEGLVALRYENARPTDGDELAYLAVAVQTLMHEAQHVRGVVNEAGAECYGLQMTRDAARRLGANRPYAATLARTYWTEVYELLPAGYRSDECRDGGALDASPNSRVWP